MMKQQPEQGLAKSQTGKTPEPQPAPAPVSGPPSTPDFPERRDDPAQAEELERQQDA
jgi:hypothetical protein